jgi:hypothetical protein
MLLRRQEVQRIGQVHALRDAAYFVVAIRPAVQYLQAQVDLGAGSFAPGARRWTLDHGSPIPYNG